MNSTSARMLLQTMINYFEAGNPETDRAAKNILEWDCENFDTWQAEIQILRETGQWTGIRAPEAEILVAALRTIR